MNAGFI